MNPKARVLVLGATGQVGGALVPLLVADESVQVVAAARTPAKAEHLGVEVVEFDLDRIETFAPAYIQHSAHIGPGRDGLFALTRALPETLRYEHHVALAEGDFVILHGRFSGHGLARNWVVADIVRLDNGVLVEHWDVIQDEAREAESKSGLPMFGASFA